MIGRRRNGVLVADLCSSVAGWLPEHRPPVWLPAAVAVDGRGVARAFGERALSESPRMGWSIVRPFEPFTAPDPRQASAYLRWAMDAVGVDGRGCVVVLPLPATVSPGGAERWRRVVGSAGARALPVHRAVALATGLGLDTESTVAHMVVEAGPDVAEVAVVAAGGVAAAEAHRWTTEGLTGLVGKLQSLLRSLDPDDELDIRDRGIHLSGEAATPELAREMELRAGVAVLFHGHCREAVLHGARSSSAPLLSHLALA